MNVGHSSQSVTLRPDSVRHESREHEAGNDERRQERRVGSGSAFCPKANSHVPVAGTMQGGAPAKLSNWSVEDLQGEDWEGEDWEEMLALLEDDSGAGRVDISEVPTSESIAVGGRPANPLMFLPEAAGWGGNRSPPPDPPCSPPPVGRVPEHSEAADVQKAIIQSEAEHRLVGGA